MSKFCTFTTNCADKAKDKYLCCNACNNKKCEIKCKDAWESCKFAETVSPSKTEEEKMAAFKTTLNKPKSSKAKE